MQPPVKLTHPSRRAALLALASLALGVSDTHAADEAMAYRYWDSGRTPKRDDYLIAALKLALDKTAASYGPYTIARLLDNMSTSRVRREIHTGQRLNVYVGPWRDMDEGVPQERNFMVDTPVMAGLLGYRTLLVRRSEVTDFARITDAAQLKQLAAGLGRGWVDVKVLRHNGYKVEDSGNLATLVEMLVNKRFDYLPLSVTEAGSVLAQDTPLTRQLTTVPDLVLYYPLPSMFYVSPNTPRLAERMDKGLATAKRDGSLDELTARHFQKEIKQLKSSTMRCFALANPLLPKRYAAEPPTLVPPGGRSAAST